jgi:hypothetical protein
MVLSPAPQAVDASRPLSRQRCPPPGGRFVARPTVVPGLIEQHARALVRSRPAHFLPQEPGAAKIFDLLMLPRCVEVALSGVSR